VVGNRVTRSEVSTLKQFAKMILAAVTAVTVAAPLPAAPAAGKAPLHKTVRFRGVPTFANSTLADIPSFAKPLSPASAATTAP
jgi:hypothetical protein